MSTFDFPYRPYSKTENKSARIKNLKQQSMLLDLSGCNLVFLN